MCYGGHPGRGGLWKGGTGRLAKLPPTWFCIQFAEPVESWISSLVTCFPPLPHPSPSLHSTETQLTCSDEWGAFPR